MNLLTNALAFIFALGIIIFVHEGGHLMMAKAFKVRVMTFSLGFGKRLWGFTRNGTDYRVSAIPFGGYVRMGGENPEESTGDPNEFLSKPRWQRILVYLAGPAMNFILAIGLFAILFMVGIEVPNLPDTPPLIGGVQEGSSAAQAGLRRGDLIVSIKGEEVDSWQDALTELLTSAGRPVPLGIKRGEQTFTAVVTPTKDPRSELGDLAGLYPSFRPQITHVAPGGPAEKAGLKPGDEIRSIDGNPVADSRDFVSYIEKRPGQPIRLQIMRDGRPLEIPVTPQLNGTVGRVGIQLGIFQRYAPLRAVQEGARYSLELVRQTFQIIGKIFNREVSAKGALAGPIEIAAQSGAAAREGFKTLVHLMGFLSIGIAIMNLMPIPILDGGQTLILMVEGVIRRDLSLRLKEAISHVGFILILLLTVMVLWFDLLKHMPEGLIPGS
ncbi:MAG TPA: RIP metalloprotease RseP [Thermoanaerobaculia bacterium]|nr:RIP metalloprotease RseP [Thermoanaerobaculia bacterium]